MKREGWRSRTLAILALITNLAGATRRSPRSRPDIEPSAAARDSISGGLSTSQTLCARLRAHRPVRRAAALRPLVPAQRGQRRRQGGQPRPAPGVARRGRRVRTSPGAGRVAGRPRTRAGGAGAAGRAARDDPRCAAAAVAGRAGRRHPALLPGGERARDGAGAGLLAGHGQVAPERGAWTPTALARAVAAYKAGNAPEGPLRRRDWAGPSPAWP